VLVTVRSGSVAPLSMVNLENLKEKIIQLLVAHKGEQYQSEIVKVLGIPKSTVGITLNSSSGRSYRK
jgi:uncharacterized membrane protein